MKNTIASIRLSLGVVLVFCFASPAFASQPNTLSDQEKAQGWRLLFDGKSLDGWRGFKKDKPPEKGWTVEEDCLAHVDGAGGGDIITVDQFTDYEFQFEWKVAPGSNSGVKYFITENRGGAIGHEYQVLDDLRHPDAKRGLDRRAAAFYHVLPVDGNKELKPVGEFNHSKIVVNGKHIEHWLNSAKVLEYELGSDRVKQAIAKSKFKDVNDFGTKIKHHLLLQDHGDAVWYRNLKIREIKKD